VIEHERVWLERMPANYADVAPRVIELDNGMQAWKFEDRIIPTIGLNAVVGKDPTEFGINPLRYEEMLPGCHPASRQKLADSLKNVSDDAARKIAEDNARRVFDFPRAS
jgi:hypothetical protein